MSPNKYFLSYLKVLVPFCFLANVQAAQLCNTHPPISKNHIEKLFDTSGPVYFSHDEIEAAYKNAPRSLLLCSEDHHSTKNAIGKSIKEGDNTVYERLKKEGAIVHGSKGICAHCGIFYDLFKRNKKKKCKCEGCGQLRYCSRHCQKKHWNLEHRLVCKALKEAKEKKAQPKDLKPAQSPRSKNDAKLNRGKGRKKPRKKKKAKNPNSQPAQAFRKKKRQKKQCDLKRIPSKNPLAKGDHYPPKKGYRNIARITFSSAKRSIEPYQEIFYSPITPFIISNINKEKYKEVVHFLEKIGEESCSALYNQYTTKILYAIGYAYSKTGLLEEATRPT